MKKRIVSLLTIAVILFSVLSLSAVSVSARKASDYGMYVRMWECYRTETKGNLVVSFVLGANEKWDVSYTAKLFDSNGKAVATWMQSPRTMWGGSVNQFEKFTVYGADKILTVGSTYTFRLYGECFADGSVQSFYWDYPIKYRTNLYDFSSKDYGMGVSYNFSEYDYGDITFNLWLSAVKTQDVTYRVRLVDPDGDSIYFWNDITIEAGVDYEKYIFKTFYGPVMQVGTYKIIVTGFIDYGGIHASFDWTFKYEFN